MDLWIDVLRSLPLLLTNNHLLLFFVRLGENLRFCDVKKKEDEPYYISGL